MNNFIKNHLHILEKNNFSYPEIELRALLNKTSKSKKEIIFSNFKIKQIRLDLFNIAFERRLNKEPLSKIFNEKEFFGSFQPQRSATGFVPKLDKDSELFNVWTDEIDNPKLYDLRGELALLRTYLQFTVAQHGDYPEATDIRLAQKLMQQITTSITDLMELEIKLKLLVDVTDVKMMIEKIIGVILEADIEPQQKIKLAEEIQKVTKSD